MARYTLETLVEIMGKLRSPEGCPWDREQTHESIKRYLLEEVYEFIDAIHEDAVQKMKDELGDILFQIVFHCKLASEEGKFDIYDVIKTTSEKMIRRHPHVFADKKVDTAHDVIVQWDEIKKAEDAHKDRVSIIDGVPVHMPSLMRACKVQKKAAKVGFDWEKPEQIMDKIKEEVQETGEALESGDMNKIKEEIGDLFFAVANLARFLHCDPEELSQHAVNKFIKRFKKVEQVLSHRGKRPEDSSLAEMDEIWNSTKNS